MPTMSDIVQIFNYDISLEMWIILAFWVVSILVCVFFIDLFIMDIRRSRQFKGKNILYLFIFLLFLPCFIYCMIRIIQEPEPKKFSNVIQYYNYFNIERV